MKKVLQNWTITSGLQSVSQPCNLNLMLPPHFCTDLNKDVFLAVRKYHSMYRRRTCIKHLWKVKMALSVALYWGFVSPCAALRDWQPGPPQPAPSLHSRAWQAALRRSQPLTTDCTGPQFLPSAYKDETFFLIFYSEPAHMSSYLAHTLLWFSSCFFLLSKSSWDTVTRRDNGSFIPAAAC